MRWPASPGVLDERRIEEALEKEQEDVEGKRCPPSGARMIGSKDKPRRKIRREPALVQAVLDRLAQQG